jgi:RNA methyltransferase, TrmH family
MELTRGEQRLFRRLRERRFRAAEQRFLADGAKVVAELLDSPVEVDLVALSSSQVDGDLAAGVAARGIPVRWVDDAMLAELAPTETPQGVLAVGRIPARDPAGIRWEGGISLLLDGVQDPGNLGTLVRSAEAFAAPGVIALPGTVDPWNAKSVRASAGSLFRVAVLSLGWEEAASLLRAAGAPLLGADMSGEPVGPATGSAGLVVGNEGAGLSPEVRGGVDGLISVPTPGPVESLNVASAAAILLYALNARPPGSPQ